MIMILNYKINKYSTIFEIIYLFPLDITFLDIIELIYKFIF